MSFANFYWKIFQMGVFSRFLRAIASCLPDFGLWFATAPSRSPSTATPSQPTVTRAPSPSMRSTSTAEPKRNDLPSEVLQARLKKALAEEYFCSGHEPVEDSGYPLMECGCQPGRHGPLAITKQGELIYLP